MAIGLLAGALALSAGASASDGDGANRATNAVRQAVTACEKYTIFDHVVVSLDRGVATLDGMVTSSSKRDELEQRVGKVDGVQRVVNRLGVLPASADDDDLRYRIARRIYTNPNFRRYAAMARPPIHILVEHGHVTLIGFVDRQVDKVLAQWLTAQSGARSVTNNLTTGAEPGQESSPKA